ncbi:DNA polymerase III subunit beta [Rhabdochromatium marinum]|uniref:DNA polymerase III subunit beta n=1 Tax=Rhabdochromatium marinum TaxID=48729 RepID=UPI00190755F8|nr:DNA polymerase III subunit beta [Rhabdochromatium marinum]MBK1647956.1 DNA polymerase III subunit beta [Rhabdochromatium marinum]
MKIEVQREDLVPTLMGVAAVVERRQTLPILGNLLIKTTEQGFSISATDLELQISSHVQAKVLEPGSITLPAKKFADICKALPEKAHISVEISQNRASIRCGRSRFSLSTLPAEDYPTLEGEEGQQFFELETAVLAKMIERTSFAMAHQDVRYYLNGLLLEICPGKLIAVATDGHRLAKAEAEIAALNSCEDTKQLILPAKTVSELKRLLSSKVGATVQLDIGDRSIVIRAAETVITSKLIDGRYPDYARVIPSHLESSAVVDREMLRDSLSRTTVLSYEKQKGVRMTFEEGLLRLEVSNPEHEEAQEEVGIDYSGQTITIGFNVGYWLDVLTVMDGKTAEIRFLNSEVSAILVDPESSGELYVVMPMRI